MHTPASAQAVTLRTVPPHASRVVRPTSSSLRHRLGDARELHEVELHVLPRGDVAEAARVFVGDVGERVDLRADEHALRNLDAQHVDVRLALAVGAAREAIDLELIGGQLARFEAAQVIDEVIDVGGAGEAKRLGRRGHGSVVHDDDKCRVRGRPGQAKFYVFLTGIP